MSMTPEQREKAERAIFHKQVRDLLKRHALQHRNKCMRDVPFYSLPYRLLYDLEQPPEQVPLNHFYPRRACSSETEKRAWEAVQAARDSRGDLSDEEIQKIRENIESADYTPEADRERLFTCFLNGIDFSVYRSWDWTGQPVTEQETARLQAYYEGRQRDYLENPDRYSPPALVKDDPDPPEYYGKDAWELIQEFEKIRNLD